MKSFIVIILLIVLFAGVAFAQSDETTEEAVQDGRDFSTAVGIFTPGIGFNVSTNEAGQITGVSGINFALGFSRKNYFNPVEFGSFNGFWQWGTLALIVPYLGIGADYVFESGFFIGVGTIWLAPYLSIGIYF
jgi:hypothetical protein